MSKVVAMMEPEKRKPTTPALITIRPPNTQTATITAVGTSPYLSNKFSSENKAKMQEAQAEGSTVRKGRRAKPPKDFEKVYKGSMHVSTEGWYGIPTNAFRAAMIDACRGTELDMTRAKMAVRIIAEGYDAETNEPLVRIKGDPRMSIMRVKIGMNQTDLAARGIFDKWSVKLTIQWDADLFSADSVANLLARAGEQVGVGAGRQLSKTSVGIGMGSFKIEV